MQTPADRQPLETSVLSLGDVYFGIFGREDTHGSLCLLDVESSWLLPLATTLLSHSDARGGRSSSFQVVFSAEDRWHVFKSCKASLGETYQ